MQRGQSACCRAFVAKYLQTRPVRGWVHECVDGRALAPWHRRQHWRPARYVTTSAPHSRTHCLPLNIRYHQMPPRLRLLPVQM